jgi:hypothetical protein
VQLDAVGRPHARRRGQIDTGVADRGRDAGERTGLVVDLDRQVEGDLGTLTRNSVRRASDGARHLRPIAARVGRPAPAPVVVGYFACALLCWVAATVQLIHTSAHVAAGDLAAPGVLLAVHLVGLGFLPLAVSGGALHVLPMLLRTELSRLRGPCALPLLCAGPLLAYGIAEDHDWLLWPAAFAETVGFVLIAWELVALVLRAPRGRVLLASRTGVALSTGHAAAALLLGAVLADRGWRPLWGIPHERLIAIHLHLAVIGWLTLLLITVGRTLGPMLALAPAEPPRRAPVEELVLTAGLWLLLAGFAFGVRLPELAGALLVAAAIVRFALVLGRIAREHRLDVPEGPLLHFLTGLFFLAQAGVLGIAMLLGAAVTPRRLTAYVLTLLVGWAAGATIGHLGKLLSLSVWAWWPPGPRPKQAALYPRRLWIVEAVLFAAGIEIAVDGILAGSQRVVAAGGVLLVAGALVACVAGVLTLRAGWPAFRRRLTARDRTRRWLFA